jgi:sensor histidine kinase YesM
MKVNWGWFLIGYLLFYLLVNFSFALPNEFDGNSIAVLLRNSSRSFGWRVMDLTLWFIFSLVPYLILVWLYPKRKLYCFLVLSIGVIATCVFRFYCDRLIANYPIPLNAYLFKNSYFLLCFNLYAIVFFFIRYAQYKALQAKELLIESRQAELSFLRSQVNPHFLFNSLNNIYALVYEKSEYSLSAIAGLADLLRYMVYDSTKNVPLEKEIDYIKKYISLQQLRYENPVTVKLQISGPIQEINFPPLLFLPFVENAFKHGEFNNADDELAIDITCKKEKTIFHSRNKKSELLKDPSVGIGLQNVRRRLELLYPGKHSLSIQDRNEHFDVTLIIIHEV